MDSPGLRQFSLIQLLVLLLALGMVVLWIVAGTSAHNSREAVSVCATNLRGIGSALYIYAQGPDEFPTLTTSRRAGEMTLFRYRHQRPAADAVPSPTGDMWMLVYANNTTPKQFICPATTDVQDPAQDSTSYYDFASAVNLSYAYVYQYHRERTPLGVSSNPRHAIMADANPYLKGAVKVPPMSDLTGSGRGNSFNHRPRWGQNVLFQDSHVQFVLTPRVGSVQHGAVGQSAYDNIYTTTQPSGSNTVIDEAPSASGVMMGGVDDTCLVP
jgi:hypothetical protein